MQTSVFVDTYTMGALFRLLVLFHFAALWLLVLFHFQALWLFVSVLINRQQNKEYGQPYKHHRIDILFVYLFCLVAFAHDQRLWKSKRERETDKTKKFCLTFIRPKSKFRLRRLGLDVVGISCIQKDLTERGKTKLTLDSRVKEKFYWIKYTKRNDTMAKLSLLVELVFGYLAEVPWHD